MFKRILVAVDGSPTSNNGFTVALDVAKEQQAELYALHVVDEMMAIKGAVGAEYGAPTYFDTMLDDLRKAGSKLLSKAEATAAKSGQRIKPILAETQARSVAGTIVAQARKLGVDLIVMGTHGRRGLSRLVMGSDAEGVLREAPAPVLLVRGAAARRISRGSTRSIPVAPKQTVAARAGAAVTHR